MTTPTGFLFNNNGNIVDLSDVFQPKTSGVSITTNFISTANSGQDLGALFQAGNSGLTTGYISTTNSNQDLGSLFASIDIYTVTGGTNYTESIIGNTYTLTFNPNTFNLTFNVIVSTVTITAVGGGGGGRGSGWYPNSGFQNYLVGGVGGGGASSIQSSLSTIIATSSYNLIVGQGGAGGVIGEGPPQGSPGTDTSVTSVTGTSFNSTAPGGKTSNSIIQFDTGITGGLKYVYYPQGVTSSNAPTSSGSIINSSIGGGSIDGSGITTSGGSATSYESGGNGGNASNGSLPYGGGGGTTKMISDNLDTFFGSIVSLNNNGGVEGGRVVNTYLPLNLPGNQISTYGSTQNPGLGSGGGGGGMYFNVNFVSNSYFGAGGNGGDGVIIVQFTYP